MRKHGRHPQHTRRGFLKLGLTAAGAAGALLQAGTAHAGADVAHDRDAKDVPEDARAFALGVSSGDATSTTAHLWTRYDGDRALRLVVWREAGAAQVVHHDAPLGVRGAVLVPVDGLTPATEYRYAFYALERGAPVSRSRLGRFKTAPADDALVPVTLGATCCIMNGMPQTVLAAAGARRDLDAIIQLGDAVYADGSKNLAEYRGRWWENLSQPGYQAMRASASTIATWDDHEVDNDWDPESEPADKIVAARGAFFEHMPMCRDDAHPARIWRKQRFGRTVEVFVLDSRGERKRSATPREYLSPEQLAWLKAGLLASDAMFKVIVSSVPISKFPLVFALSMKDRWEGYPEQRRDLLSFIEKREIPGVVFLSGDFHLAMIARASPTGPGARTLEVLAGPGAQVGHPLAPWLYGAQFDWASARNNVTALCFDPLRERLDVRYQGDDGLDFHHGAYRRRPDAGFEKIEDWLV